MDIDFPRVNKLPPYIFDEIQKLKMEAKVAVSPGMDLVTMVKGM